MYLPIQQTRLYEQIVEQIEQRVLDGILEPGDQLPPERELCEQFNVSRTVVREAVRALHEKGLVTIRPGRGTFITDGTSEAMRQSLGLVFQIGNDSQADLIEVRYILEPQIAALAAQKATDTDIEEMQAAITTMDQVLDDDDKYIAADLAFHSALAKATGNALIPILIDPMIDLLWQQRKRIFLASDGAKRGQVYHKRILAAVEEHDSQAACDAMHAHMEQVRADSTVIK